LINNINSKVIVLCLNLYKLISGIPYDKRLVSLRISIQDANIYGYAK